MKTLIFLLSLVSVNAVAANWLPFARDTGGQEYYLDLDSYRYTDKVVDYWHKVIQKKGYSLVNFAVNCQTRDVAALKVLIYSKKGILIDESTQASQVPIVPDSVLEREVAIVCKIQEQVIQGKQHQL